MNTYGHRDSTLLATYRARVKQVLDMGILDLNDPIEQILYEGTLAEIYKSGITDRMFMRIIRNLRDSILEVKKAKLNSDEMESLCQQLDNMLI